MIRWRVVPVVRVRAVQRGARGVKIVSDARTRAGCRRASTSRCSGCTRSCAARCAKPEPRPGVVLVDRPPSDRRSRARRRGRGCTSSPIAAIIAGRCLALDGRSPLAARSRSSASPSVLEIPVPSLGSAACARGGNQSRELRSALHARCCIAAAVVLCATRPRGCGSRRWQFLALLALNAIAAVIVFLLRATDRGSWSAGMSSER